MHKPSHDVELRNGSNRNQRAEPRSYRWCWVTGFAQRIMLCLADRAFDHWLGRNLARNAWSICRVPHRNPCCRRFGAGLGMGASLEAAAMRKPKAINRVHTRVYDARIPTRRQFIYLGGRRSQNHACFVQAKQMKRWLLSFSLGGAGLAAVCCLTPFLPWLFSILGIRGALGYVYRDSVLLPILAGFLILTGYALWQRKQTK